MKTPIKYIWTWRIIGAAAVLFVAVLLGIHLFVSNTYEPPTPVVENPSLPRTLYKANYKDSLEVFRARYGHRKHLLPEYELAFYVAMRMFPELENIQITLTKKNIQKGVSITYRHPFNCFNPFQKHYIMELADEAEASGGLQMSDYSFNAMVGFFGYELQNVFILKNSSALSSMIQTIKLLSPAYVKSAIHFTGKLSVKRGFKWQYYDYIEKSTMPIDGDLFKFQLRHINFYLSCNDIINGRFPEFIDNFSQNDMLLFGFFFFGCFAALMRIFFIPIINN